VQKLVEEISGRIVADGGVFLIALVDLSILARNAAEDFSAATRRDDAEKNGPVLITQIVVEAKISATFGTLAQQVVDQTAEHARVKAH